MSEKVSYQSNYLVERDNDNIDVFKPTGKGKTVETIDPVTGQFVTKSYAELTGSSLETVNGVTGYPEKDVERSKLAPDNQARLAHDLAVSRPSWKLEQMRRKLTPEGRERLFGGQTLRGLGVEAPSALQEAPSMISVPEAFLLGGVRREYIDPNVIRNVPVEGIPSSALYAPGSPYDPDRAEKDALARHIQNVSERSNNQE